MEYAIIHELHNTWEYQSDSLEEIMEVFRKLDHRYDSYVVVKIIATTDSSFLRHPDQAN